MALSGDENRWRALIEECLRREIGAPLPDLPPTQDLIATGVLDSMGWVSVLRSLESASGFPDLGGTLNERVPSIASIVDALRSARPADVTNPVAEGDGLITLHEAAYLLGSSFVVGSRTVPSEEVDRAFGMPVGKLRKRAGIESLAYVVEGEDELTLGARAAQQALHDARCPAQEVDWIVAASETHHAYPSLAAQLHAQLLARETCGAFDVGGACLGLLNAFAIAQSFIASGQARTILVVTADVHSRVLAPGRVAGEFGGLFGDGASAFLLRATLPAETPSTYRFGEFLFGCAGQYAGAIRVAERGAPKLDVHFDGDALSRAAITRLEKVIRDLEARSGLALSALAGLATHQPNPRLVALLAKQCGLAEEKFPEVARRYGNLGSSTTGVALHLLLKSAGAVRPTERSLIFLASLGPGLLYGGGWLVPAPPGLP